MEAPDEPSGLAQPVPVTPVQRDSRADRRFNNGGVPARMGPCEPIFNTAGEVIAVHYFDLPVQRNMPGELRQNVGDLNYDMDDSSIVFCMFSHHCEINPIRQL